MRAFRREFRKSADVLVGRSEAMRRSDYFRNLALLPQAAKELRVFGLHVWVVERFRHAFRTAIGPVRRARRSSWRLQTWAPALFFVTEFATFSLLGRAALRGEISLGEFAVFTQAAFGLAGVASLSNHDLFIEYGAPAVAAALELETVTAAPHIMLSGGGPATGLPQSTIRFEGVTFRYPGQQREVLRDFSLDIPAGRSIAVVGDNGAGKTTLVKCLPSLRTRPAGASPSTGGPAGTRRREWQQRSARCSRTSCTTSCRSPTRLFGATDHDGLRVAGERAAPSPSSTTCRRDGTRCCRGIHRRHRSFRWSVAAHRTGPRHVRSGQRRRRLVLDEPSANLDVRAEAELYDRFLELTTGLTTILISHRFSTVRRADRIVVVDQGRVIEDGTHDDLVACGGRYAAMFGMQAARFAP